MKVKISGIRIIYITGEHIKLDALLKFSSITSSGGDAKVLIQKGKVYVNKEVCTSRGRKIRPGTVIRCGNSVLLVKHEEERRCDRAAKAYL